MIELTNSQVQIIPVGGTATFNVVVVKSGCAERHRAGSGQIDLVALGRHLATFSGNISVPTGETVGEVALAISQEGETRQGTVMRATPAAVNEYFNVSTQTYVDVYSNCTGSACCQTISVKNVGTIPVQLDNPNFTAVRVNGR